MLRSFLATYRSLHARSTEQINSKGGTIMAWLFLETIMKIGSREKRETLAPCARSPAIIRDFARARARARERNSEFTRRDDSA